MCETSILSVLILCFIQTEHVLLWSQLDEIEVCIFLSAFLSGPGQGLGEPTGYVSDYSVGRIRCSLLTHRQIC